MLIFFAQQRFDGSIRYTVYIVPSTIAIWFLLAISIIRFIHYTYIVSNSLIGLNSIEKESSLCIEITFQPFHPQIA